MSIKVIKVIVENAPLYALCHSKGVAVPSPMDVRLNMKKADPVWSVFFIFSYVCLYVPFVILQLPSEFPFPILLILDSLLLHLVKLMIQLHQRPLLDAGDIRAGNTELLGDLPLRSFFSSMV
jgi:hypothetical protein